MTPEQIEQRNGHPEALRGEGELYAMRCPDGGHVVFAAESGSRLLDVPKPVA